MPNFLGFQYRRILDLYSILFHAVVVFGPEREFLFKFALKYCAQQPILKGNDNEQPMIDIYVAGQDCATSSF